MYSQINQSMENDTKQFNTPTRYRRHDDKLSAAARQLSKIGGGGAHELSVAARRRALA